MEIGKKRAVNSVFSICGNWAEILEIRQTFLEIRQKFVEILSNFQRALAE